MHVQTWFKGIFLGAAGLSFLLSVYLWFVTGNKDQALFVGLWVPSILSLGNLLQPASRDS